ncbi:MAG: dihydropteroate synthase [Lachnospiraceae bacterium]|nr:dihydropteroate synthase [Lachnospiraceae bacterium]MDY5742702.1 dihydropteroate synthase [Lachnospiraceae bacterium]
MRIGNKEFDTARQVYVMGILNVTPDSFSDGGQYDRPEAAFRQVERMIAEGADIIDIGGESTRPGHVKVSIEEEIERVLPVISAIRQRFDIPISLDTYKHQVAAACAAQIDMVNDIWGLRYDEGQMARLVAEHDLAYCLMHNRPAHDYTDFLPDFLADIRTSLNIAEQAGIGHERIMLDGGVGFQKTVEENLTVLRYTKELAELGYPVLIATSRKSFIGKILDREVDDRLFGTLATAAWGIIRGASFIRVHDVAAHRQVIDVIRSIQEERIWIR